MGAPFIDNSDQILDRESQILGQLDPLNLAAMDGGRGRLARAERRARASTPRFSIVLTIQYSGGIPKAMATARATAPCLSLVLAKVFEFATFLMQFANCRGSCRGPVNPPDTIAAHHGSGANKTNCCIIGSLS